MPPIGESEDLRGWVIEDFEASNSNNASAWQAFLLIHIRLWWWREGWRLQWWCWWWWWWWEWKWWCSMLSYLNNNRNCWHPRPRPSRCWSFGWDNIIWLKWYYLYFNDIIWLQWLDLTLIINNVQFYPWQPNGDVDVNWPSPRCKGSSMLLSARWVDPAL